MAKEKYRLTAAMSPWWDTDSKARSMGASLDVHTNWYLEIVREPYAGTGTPGKLHVYVRWDDGEGGYGEEDIVDFCDELETNELVIEEMEDGGPTRFYVNEQLAKEVDTGITPVWPWKLQAHALSVYGGAGYPEKTWDLCPIEWYSDDQQCDTSDFDYDPPTPQWIFTGNGSWDQDERIYVLPANSPANWHGEYHCYFYSYPPWLYEPQPHPEPQGLATLHSPVEPLTFVHFQATVDEMEGLHQDRGVFGSDEGLDRSLLEAGTAYVPVAMIEAGGTRFGYWQMGTAVMVATTDDDGREVWSVASIAEFDGYTLLDVGRSLDGSVQYALLYDADEDALYLSRNTNGIPTDDGNWSDPVAIVSGVTATPLGRIEDLGWCLAMWYQTGDGAPAVLTNTQDGVAGEWT